MRVTHRVREFGANISVRLFSMHLLASFLPARPSNSATPQRQAGAGQAGAGQAGPGQAGPGQARGANLSILCGLAMSPVRMCTRMNKNARDSRAA